MRGKRGGGDRGDVLGGDLAAAGAFLGGGDDRLHRGATEPLDPGGQPRIGEHGIGGRYRPPGVERPAHPAIVEDEPAGDAGVRVLTQACGYYGADTAIAVPE